jgi:hypothetical protein
MRPGIDDFGEITRFYCGRRGDRHRFHYALGSDSRNLFVCFQALDEFVRQKTDFAVPWERALHAQAD